jgi:hypothetical protein
MSLSPILPQAMLGGYSRRPMPDAVRGSSGNRDAASPGRGDERRDLGHQRKTATDRKLQIRGIVGRQSFGSRQRKDLAPGARGCFVVGRDRQVGD